METELGAGRSMESLAREAGCDPSTIAHWAQQHGVSSTHASRHAARGGLSRELLAALVAEDLSIAEIAARVDRGASTVRHWLRYHGLETTAAARRRRNSGAEDGGDAAVAMLRAARSHPARAPRRRRLEVCPVLVGGRLGVATATQARGSSPRRAARARRAATSDASRRSSSTTSIRPAKRFNLSLKGLARSYAEARAEAQKCVLLCANCHAEVEAGVLRLPR